MKTRTIKILALFFLFAAIPIVACAHYPSGTEQVDEDAGVPTPDGGGCTVNCPPDGGGTPPDGGGTPPDGGEAPNPDGGAPTPDGGGGGTDGGVPTPDGGGGGGSDGGTPPECTVDADCPEGKSCEDGVCVCDGDDDDGGDNVCQTGKVLLCHYPPGNPGNEHPICVGAPAVPAHQAHGDTLGACP